MTTDASNRSEQTAGPCDSRRSAIVIEERGDVTTTFESYLTDRTVEQVDTSQIREGDIVLECGMVVLVGPVKVYGVEYGHPEGEPVYAWPGRVLNADELCDKANPAYDAYVACHLRGTWCEDAGGVKDRWTIQGNRLAPWTVVRGPHRCVCLKGAEVDPAGRHVSSCPAAGMRRVSR